MENLRPTVPDLLRDAACNTLENLAFTELEPAPAGELPEPGEAILGARIALGADGILDLYVSLAFLREISEVLYSPGPGGLDESFLPDTLAELLNIIAGRFLEALHGGAADFAMGLPVPHDDIRAWSGLPVRLRLTAGDGREIGLGFRPDSSGL